MIGVDGQNARVLEIASSDNRSFNPTFPPLRAGLLDQLGVHR